MKCHFCLSLVIFFFSLSFADQIAAEGNEEFPWEIFYPSFVNPRGASAGETDSTGKATLLVKGRAFNFQLIDEATENPIPGLCLGLAVDMAVGGGVLVVIDPKDTYSPQMIILHNKPSTSSQTGKLRTQATSSLISTLVRLSVQPSRTIDELVIEQLPRYTQRALDLLTCLDLTELSIKTLSRSSSIDKWEEKLGFIEKKTITQTEAWNEVFNDFKKGLNQELFFVTATYGAGLPVGLEGVAINLLKFGIDATSVWSCGYPGSAVTVNNYGPIKFYGCDEINISDRVKGLVKANVKDPSGGYVGRGSLELLSKTNLGLGFKQTFDTGNGVQMEVPIGDYLAIIRSPSFNSTTEYITVAEEGVTLNEVLNHPETPVALSISSASCTVGERFSWGTIAYNNVRVSGIATGPVGSFVDGPTQCSAWTNCERLEGDSPSTSWTLNTTTGAWSPQYYTFSLDGISQTVTLTCPTE